MTKRKRIEIETDEVLVIRRSRNVALARCSQCAGQPAMVSLEEAASLAGINTSTLYGLVEAGELHFRETAAGLLLICLNSLFKR